MGSSARNEGVTARVKGGKRSLHNKWRTRATTSAPVTDDLCFVRPSQLSYADTHPMFTRKSYPNFFRIVPSENAFNAPRVELLKAFNWTRVGTLYQNEPRFALVSALHRLVYFVRPPYCPASPIRGIIIRAVDARVCGQR